MREKEKTEAKEKAMQPKEGSVSSMMSTSVDLQEAMEIATKIKKLADRLISLDCSENGEESANKSKNETSVHQIALKAQKLKDSVAKISVKLSEQHSQGCVIKDKKLSSDQSASSVPEIEFNVRVGNQGSISLSSVQSGGDVVSDSSVSFDPSSNAMSPQDQESESRGVETKSREQHTFTSFGQGRTQSDRVGPELETPKNKNGPTNFSDQSRSTQSIESDHSGSSQELVSKTVLMKPETVQPTLIDEAYHATETSPLCALQKKGTTSPRSLASDTANESGEPPRATADVKVGAEENQHILSQLERAIKSYWGASANETATEPQGEDCDTSFIGSTTCESGTIDSGEGSETEKSETIGSITLSNTETDGFTVGSETVRSIESTDSEQCETIGSTIGSTQTSHLERSEYTSSTGVSDSESETIFSKETANCVRSGSCQADALSGSERSNIEESDSESTGSNMPPTEASDNELSCENSSTEVPESEHSETVHTMGSDSTNSVEASYLKRTESCAPEKVTSNLEPNGGDQMAEAHESERGSGAPLVEPSDSSGTKTKKQKAVPPKIMTTNLTLKSSKSSSLTDQRLVKYFSFSPNTERGFEVLLDDYNAFSPASASYRSSSFTQTNDVPMSGSSSGGSTEHEAAYSDNSNESTPPPPPQTGNRPPMSPVSEKERRRRNTVAEAQQMVLEQLKEEPFSKRRGGSEGSQYSNRTRAVLDALDEDNQSPHVSSKAEYLKTVSVTQRTGRLVSGPTTNGSERRIPPHQPKKKSRDVIRE